MKRNTKPNKLSFPKFRKLKGKALARVRRAALAQSYYARADELLITIDEREDGQYCVTAETLPSTSLPNIMGIRVGDAQDRNKFCELMESMAESCDLRCTTVINRREAA